MKFKDINPLRQNSNRDPCWGNVINHCSEEHVLFVLPRGNCIFLFLPSVFFLGSAGNHRDPRCRIEGS